MKALFDRYLKILGISTQEPDFAYLKKIVHAHLTRIPFENISKLYNHHILGLKTIPDLEFYLRGISEHNFGGTCYANNYHMHQLLDHLGFQVRLCGAGMSMPDHNL